jgi:hypothetical protein
MPFIVPPRRADRLRQGCVEAVLALVVLFTFGASCRPGTPVIDPGEKPPTISGTVSGAVFGEGRTPVPDRTVTAIDEQSGMRYEAKTNANGQYTLKLPVGKYRMELQVLPGEVIVKEPGVTEINASDLDPDRSFEIRLKPRG